MITSQPEGSQFTCLPQPRGLNCKNLDLITPSKRARLRPWSCLAPQAGLEPATLPLTAESSAIQPLRSKLEPRS